MTSINDYLFYNCSALTNINIPDNITSIGDYAFMFCKSLTFISIPIGVTSIGKNAFQDCTNLRSIRLSACLRSIGECAFGFCNSLTSITIPTGVTIIDRMTFLGCEALTSVVIPDSVTSIGGFAFSDCTGLTSVTIPESVESIGWGAFYCCDSLTDVYYLGSEAQWNEIMIEDNNDPLYNAVIHYNASIGQGTIPVSAKITVNNGSAVMALGTKKLLSVTIENPKKQKLLYSSSDPSVVSVSVVGVVTANAPGIATIKVQTYDKAHSVTCDITVTNQGRLPYH